MKSRFDVLDSWRGICACLVVLFHFKNGSLITNVEFIRNSYLFVDFFFVLSGFIIAKNYQERLLTNYSVRKFMILRFGRLYPLHLLMLILFIGLELVWYIKPEFSMVGHGSTPFTNPTRTPYTIVSNLLLVQSLGVHDADSWNFPSWSISTEFYTYILFALATCAPKHWYKRIIIGSIIIAPLIVLMFRDGDFNVTWKLGIFRCVNGFSIGVITYWLYSRLSQKAVFERLPSSVVSTFEVVGVFFAIGSVTWVSPSVSAFSAPYVFAFVLIVFTLETGFISRVLRSKPMLMIGALSYSIYLTHIFVRWGFSNVWANLHKIPVGTDIISILNKIEPFWMLNIQAVSYVLSVIAFSYFTFNFVEMPARNWFRNIANRNATSQLSPAAQTVGKN